jgi:SAM-dependent methyltransferase
MNRRRSPSRAPSTDEVWERFAREFAEYYILTEVVDYDAPLDLSKFFGSAQPEVTEILTVVDKWLHRRKIAIEVGAGVGRLAILMAREFDAVHAVDVSPTMLARLEENCVEAGIGNVVPVLTTSAEDLIVEADLVYSRLVFQHIEDWAGIEFYARLIRGWIERGGVAYLQFDTRRQNPAYWLRNALPDRLLPRTSRRGIRRIRRKPAEVRALFRREGLTILDERGARSADHVFVLTATKRGGCT